MDYSFFLGANSKDGFYSLYSGFAAQKGDMLHIIKGGPGTGKSSFMRKIAAAAQERGYDVQSVLCSGDPDSLDGVYIPALRQGWVDGTAPHVIEPRCYGVDSDYVNLGSFCSTDFTDDESERQRGLYRDYREQYRRAYAYLAAAGAARGASPRCPLSGGQRAALRKRIGGIIQRAKPDNEAPSYAASRLFMSALSCRGLLRLDASVSALCKTVYAFDDGLGRAGEALELTAEELRRHGTEPMLCFSPLEPERLEAVLLPKRSLGFVAGEWGIEGLRHIRLDAMGGGEDARGQRAERRAAAQLEKEALALAVQSLRRAKELHDSLESGYTAHMDFDALNEYVRELISRI